MQPITLEKICVATDGKLIQGNPSQLISNISTDTRTATGQSLFIAIKGERHDGHDHLHNAKAAALMVHRDVQSDLPIIKVDDTRKAMGQLANYVRRQLSSKVIAVAGSNGKTGTKNLIHSVLRNTLKGTLSEKSFNNDIGVPRTIFDADPDHDYVILEIGTNHPGEILTLTNIAQPDIAIITNIGAEHLEFLGNIDGVCRENAQIIAGMKSTGILILNGDNLQLLDATADFPGQKITFGFNPKNDLHPANIQNNLDGIRFNLNTQQIAIPLLGRHTAVNALAAIAVARHLNVSDADIIAGLSTATGPEMRLQLQSAGSIKIINDAYNANPNSMKAGLQTLKEMTTTGRRVAILGDMKELGPTAEQYHREIGEFAAACDLDQLICIGEKSRVIAHSAFEAGLPSEFIEHYPTTADCAIDIPNLIQPHDLILLKASNSMRLGSLAAVIMNTANEQALHKTVDARMRVALRQPFVPQSELSPG